MLETIQLEAQKISPFDEFIFSAQHDPGILALNEQLHYLSNNPYKTSFIQRLEVRSSLNQLDLQRQGYTLRTQFANPWEMRNNTHYFGKVNSVFEAQRSLMLRNLLYDRYKASLSVIFANQLHKHLLQHDSLSKALIEANQTNRLSNEFKSNAYADAIYTSANELMQNTELYLKQIESAKLITDLSGSFKAAYWTSDLLLSVYELKTRLSELTQDSVAPSVALTYEVAQLEAIQASYALKKTNVNPGFIQARYEPFRLDQQRLPWTISIGITLPLFNPNKPDMARKQLEIISQRNKVLLIENQQTSLCRLYEAQLELLIKQYEILTVQIQELQNPQLRNLLQYSQTSNPFGIIQLDQKIVGLQGQELRLRFKIYDTYLSYLKEADILQRNPITNCFSPIK